MTEQDQQDSEVDTDQQPNETLLAGLRDPTQTEHPAGKAQAARNIGDEPSG